MAESAAYARRGFKGGAKAATVAAGLSSGAVSLTGSDLSTWAGVSTNGPFAFVLDPGLSTEEVCEATTLAGNNITGITRGLRGTTAVAHDPGCTIKHVATDRDADEANFAVNGLMGNVSVGNARKALIINAAGTAVGVGDSLASLFTAQADLAYASAANTPARLPKGSGLQHLRMNAGATAPEWATLAAGVTQAIFYTQLNWVIPGAIAVPSGDTNFLVPVFVSKGASETVVIDKVRYVVNAATSVTFKLQVNGADALGFTAISCTTTAATTDPADVTLADLDKVAPVVTAISGAPMNMTISVWLKHTVTLS